MIASGQLAAVRVLIVLRVVRPGLVSRALFFVVSCFSTVRVCASGA